MRRIIFLTAFAAAVPLCQAGLIGTAVTGGLFFNGDTSFNSYDPAETLGVPATGYQNSPGNSNSATVTIVGGNELGFSTTSALIVTSFSDTGFTFTITPPGPNSFESIELTLTDPAFTGVSEISDNFYEPLTSGIAGDVITVDIPAGNVVAQVYTASFNVTSGSSGAAPEPSSFVLLGIGAAGLAALRLKSKLSLRPR